MDDDRIKALDAAWRPARLAGALGPASIEELMAHTAGYVSAVCRVFGKRANEIRGLGVDVGTGAGIPGVMLAAQLPLMSWRLVDASEKRCGLARSAARAAGVGDRATVHHRRAEEVGRLAGWRGEHDLAVARLLGGPAESAELLVPLVRRGGFVVVSADEAGVRAWGAADLSRLGAEVVERTGSGGARFVVVRRSGDPDESLPRRRSVRGRNPLF